jgi:hypothetical protein
MFANKPRTYSYEPDISFETGKEVMGLLNEGLARDFWLLDERC